MNAALLAGRTAVVTGGAGSIGAATCVALAAHGARVVVADAHAERTHETVARIAAAGGDAVAFVADLTGAGRIESLVEAAGAVDVLVNALGEHLELAGPFEESDERGWQDLYEVNLMHVLRACRATIPGMKARGHGSIVNFSSVEGIRAAPSLAVYAAFKAGVDAFTKSLAVDIARHGIRVNAIAVDKTRAFQVGHYALPADYERLVPTWIPAGRYGEPEEIANVAVFLASDLSSWIVGQTVVADGGTTAAGGWYRTPRRWTNQPLLVQYFDADESANDARPPTVQ